MNFYVTTYYLLSYRHLDAWITCSVLIIAVYIYRHDSVAIFLVTCEE